VIVVAIVQFPADGRERHGRLRLPERAAMDRHHRTPGGQRRGHRAARHRVELVLVEEKVKALTKE
jgi:hypothetical protein